MSPSHEPGSRAITIPLHSHGVRSTPSSRRTHQKAPSRPDTSSDAGPSSTSISSSQSSWPSSRSACTSTSASASYGRQSTHTHRITLTSTSKQKGKQPITTPSTSPPSTTYTHNSPLGPSMLTSSAYKSINLASHDDPNTPPRLICYTKHSQGFTWNDELFLPGYLLGRYGGSHGRRRRWGGDEDGDDDDVDDWVNGHGGMRDSNDPERCPVAEIFVTDEEAEAMMP